MSGYIEVSISQSPLMQLITIYSSDVDVYNRWIVVTCVWLGCNCKIDES